MTQLTLLRLLLSVLPLLVLALVSTLTGGTPPASAADPNTVYLPLVRAAGQVQPTPSPTPDPAAQVARMIELVNQARVADGCPAAVPSDILMRATQDWSDHLAATGTYEHAPSNWYTEPPYFYPSNGVWENLGGGDDADYLFFSGWMDSPLHRANILRCYKPGDPSYLPDRKYDIGVGFGGGYWTLAIGIP